MVKRGPATTGGREASSYNAVKHGLTAASPVIPGESADEWQGHLRGVTESLQPENYLEEQLATMIALGLWRRWRIERFEIESIANHIAAAEDDLQIARAYAERTLSKGILPEVSPEDVETTRRRRLLPPDADLDKIMRYKAAEHRQLLQNMHEFEALQARRKGDQSPLTRVDFSGRPLS
jgi:hypothetical protein